MLWSLEVSFVLEKDNYRAAFGIADVKAGRITVGRFLGIWPRGIRLLLSVDRRSTVKMKSYAKSTRYLKREGNVQLLCFQREKGSSPKAPLLPCTGPWHSKKHRLTRWWKSYPPLQRWKNETPDQRAGSSQIPIGPYGRFSRPFTHKLLWPVQPFSLYTFFNHLKTSPCMYVNMMILLLIMANSPQELSKRQALSKHLTGKNTIKFYEVNTIWLFPILQTGKLRNREIQ